MGTKKQIEQNMALKEDHRENQTLATLIPGIIPEVIVEPRDDISSDSVPLSFYATCVTHKENETPTISMDQSRN